MDREILQIKIFEVECKFNKWGEDTKLMPFSSLEYV